MINAPRGRRWLVAAILASAFGIVLFWPVLAALIFEPIAWLAWAGWRVLTSVDQGICWAILVVICAGLVIRLALVMPGPQVAQDVQAEVGRTGEDRLARWQVLAARAEGGAEGRREFLASLGLLASSVSELTRSHTPRSAPDGSGGGPIARLTRFLPSHRRTRELAAIEELLAGMETALEIRHERDSE